MTHLEKLKATFDDLGIDYSESPKRFYDKGAWIDTGDTSLEIDEGQGYCGFTAEFIFGPEGQFKHHLIWE